MKASRHSRELQQLFDQLVRQGSKSIPTFLEWLKGDTELQVLAIKGLATLKAKESDQNEHQAKA